MKVNQIMRTNVLLLLPVISNCLREFLMASLRARLYHHFLLFRFVVSQFPSIKLLKQQKFRFFDCLTCIRKAILLIFIETKQKNWRKMMLELEQERWNLNFEIGHRASYAKTHRSYLCFASSPGGYRLIHFSKPSIFKVVRTQIIVSLSLFFSQ